jgi:protein-tyrosine phosphatase
MDDGPSVMDESLGMIGMARRDGISHIFATPHIVDGLFPNKGPKIISSVEDLRSRLPEDVELFHGADVRITPDLIRRIESGEIPTLGGSGYMLIEFPEFLIPVNIEDLVFNLRLRGITPVITHPERHLRLMRDLPALAGLRDRGAMCQITAMSITGDFGPEIENASFAMIGKGLVDIVASDAHNTDTRPPVLSKAYSDVKKHFGNRTAEKLFFENPGKILEDTRCKE